MCVLADDTILACERTSNGAMLIKYDKQGKVIRSLRTEEDHPNDIVEVYLTGKPHIALSYW